MQGHWFKVLEKDEALKIRDDLHDLGWSQGKARTEELTGTIKQNLELLPGRDGEVVTKASQLICQNLMQQPEFQLWSYPGRMTSVKFNNYKDAGTYNRHTDAPFMGQVRTDFAVTVFLSDPDKYEGGVLNLETPNGDVWEVKGEPGQAFVYPCGQPHWVTPVTDGERISAIGWIESKIQEEWKRDCLAQLRECSAAFEERMFKDETGDFRKWFVDIGQVHSCLMRQWFPSK